MCFRTGQHYASLFAKADKILKQLREENDVMRHPGSKRKAHVLAITGKEQFCNDNLELIRFSADKVPCLSRPGTKDAAISKEVVTNYKTNYSYKELAAASGDCVLDIGAQKGDVCYRMLQ